MKNVLLPFAAIAMPVPASPAAATVQTPAISDDGVCITASATPADDERIFDLATTGAPDNEAMANIVLESAMRCLEQRGWSREQLGRAVVEAMSTMVGRHAAVALARNGIRVETLERWFRSLDPNMRATMELSTIADLALGQALLADGVTDAIREANSAAIGGYLAYLMLTDRIAQGLPLSSG